jgi:hypothetical protein
MSYPYPGQPDGPNQGAPQPLYGPPQPTQPVYPGQPQYPGQQAYPAPQPFAAPPTYPLPQQAYPGYPGQPPVQPRSSGMNPALIAVLAILALVIVGGGVYFFAFRGSTNVAGTWSFTVTIIGQSATAPMTLQQNGSSVTGTLDASSQLPEPITGTVSGNSITLNIAETGDSVALTGTVTDATHMSGNLTITYQDGSSNAVSGTWSASKS